MLISEASCAAVFKVVGGAWLVAFIGWIVLRWMVKSRRLRAILDGVELPEDTRTLVRRMRWTLLAAIVLGLATAGAVVAAVTCTRVVIVTEARDVEQQLLFGSSSITIDGKPVLLTQHEGIWIVNQTNAAIRVETVAYGTAYGIRGIDPRNDVVAIPARSLGWFKTKIDHFGPMDMPPSSVESRNSHDARHWLTW